MKKILMMAAMVSGAALMAATAPAMARSNVDITIGVPAVVHAQPAPVYVPRPQEHMNARPRIVERRYLYNQPRPQPRVITPARRDYDGDGVPNWKDRRPNNPYRY